MRNTETPLEVYTDIPWLPDGSSVEVWIGDAELPNDLCTSSFAIAFDDEGRLLLSNVLKRGADIPGGHIEPGEDAESAVVREMPEETGAIVHLVKKVGHLRLVVPDPPPDYRYPTPHSFQPFYLAAIQSMGAVTMPEECGDPIFCDPAIAAENPRFRLHRTLILTAAEIFRNMKASAPAAGC